MPNVFHPVYIVLELTYIMQCILKKQQDLPLIWKSLLYVIEESKPCIHLLYDL